MRIELPIGKGASRKFPSIKRAYQWEWSFPVERELASETESFLAIFYAFFASEMLKLPKNTGGFTSPPDPLQGADIWILFFVEYQSSVLLKYKVSALEAVN